jgi:hypothetical protein
VRGGLRLFSFLLSFSFIENEAALRGRRKMAENEAAWTWRETKISENGAATAWRERNENDIQSFFFFF